MAEDVRVTNMPDSGSVARVAFDLMGRLMGYLPKAEGVEGLQSRFDLYEQCYDLAHGRRGDASKVIK